ncbi:hypothetical protein EDC04DRAFT_2916011 [Pisolithus marmoratus]|nr:hypothetical protein EDC04DRAFT_2916011 [Pisolithus marmoratus]
MQHGHPKKKSKHNISGLRGQQQCSTVSEHAADTLEPDEDLAIDSEFENLELRHAVALDGLKVNFEREYEGDSTTDGSDIGEELDLEFLDDEDFGQKLLMMAEKEDGRDADWIPEQLQRKQKKCAAQHKQRPKHYKKGPDMMSKSKRTQQCYRAAWATQATLDSFQFTWHRSGSSSQHVSQPPLSQPTTNVPTQPTLNSAITVPCICQASSVISISGSENSVEAGTVQPPSISNDDLDDDDSGLVISDLESDLELLDDLDKDRMESWEDELDIATNGNGNIRDWDVLRDQMKADLKRHSRTMTASQIHQLMILCNFATLRLKGVSCIDASIEIAKQWHHGKGTHFAHRVRALARHYQVFEQLPHEKRGQVKYSRSFLHDESVQNHCRTWLSNLPAGQVTPRVLCRALHSTIFPELGITPKHPVSEQTACRWLIKLGWQKTMVKKGVYMDGHE